jgi:hypothetical protein
MPRAPRQLLEYRVLGELATHPPQLLVLGDDDRVYVFDLASGAIVPRADETGWAGTCPLDPAVN